ncbi:MAG: hypothetical protein U0176_15245 [Bacteroidia bacterium]
MDRPSKETQVARQRPQQQQEHGPEKEQQRFISPFTRDMRQGMGLADDDPRRMIDVIQPKRETNPANFFRPEPAQWGCEGQAQLAVAASGADQTGRAQDA